MKHYFAILLTIIIAGCSHPKVFILNESSNENKYFVSESVGLAFKKNQIKENPLVVINGIPFKYDKRQDTITLPLKRSDIISLDFLNINSSRIIYNEKENDGAIIITARIETQHP